MLWSAKEHKKYESKAKNAKIDQTKEEAHIDAIWTANWKLWKELSIIFLLVKLTMWCVPPSSLFLCISTQPEPFEYKTTHCTPDRKVPRGKMDRNTYSGSPDKCSQGNGDKNLIRCLKLPFLQWTNIFCHLDSVVQRCSKENQNDSIFEVNDLFLTWSFTIWKCLHALALLAQVYYWLEL